MSDVGPRKAQEITQQLMQLVMQGAQLSRSFPSAEDQEYYVSLYPDLRPLLDEVHKNCISLTQSLLEVNRSQNIPIPSLDYKDKDDIRHNYSDLVFVTDEKLESVDSFFDSLHRQANPMKPTFAVEEIKTGNSTYHVPRVANLQRPQLQFEPIDNSPSPFIPKISQKYNAKVSLEEIWMQYENLLKQDNATSSNKSDDVSMDSDDIVCLPNPYEYEIDHYEYLTKQQEARKEILYKPVENTPLTWVADSDKLHLMCQKLEEAEEIAIDLEHHAYRTYQGFTCLMQISTRSEDFIIDTLVLRNELSLLNKSFTNPAIVKVLHGSDNDILWLQRDFGLYIVNLFDTGQAARFLEYPRLSLSFLLAHFCSVVAEKKKFQLADWRVRPLPQEMIEYARSDTHYLLYIYDRLHNELLEKGKNALLSTLNNSRLISKRAYRKDIFQPNLLSVQQKCPSFNPTQMGVLEGIFAWRDYSAREEDESVRYILPNHMMIRIAELLPQDPIELFSCCNPQPPPFIKANATDLIKVIKDAMENKTFEAPSSKQHASLPPLKVPASSSLVSTSSQTQLPLPEAGKISQEELFQRADWREGASRRSASLHPSNESTVAPSSPCASFFTSKSNTKVEMHDNKKLSEVKHALSSAFSLGSVSDVPDSLEEIYKFSNANRKRNKEKKKLKEDSIKAGPVSPIKFGEEPSPKKAENPQEFMKEIGWLAEDVTPLISTAPKKGRVDGGKKNQSKGSQNVSYDYSKHKSSNYGIRKDTKPRNKRKDNEQRDTISTPSYGRASTRVRSSKPSQRSKAYVVKGKKNTKRE